MFSVLYNMVILHIYILTRIDSGNLFYFKPHQHLPSQLKLLMRSTRWY